MHGRRTVRWGEMVCWGELLYGCKMITRVVTNDRGRNGEKRGEKVKTWSQMPHNDTTIYTFDEILKEELAKL